MAKARKVLVLNVEKNEVTDSTVTTLESMQAIVGGLIQCAITLDNGDEVYVDEEGLLADPEYFFILNGYMFAGNAFVIGGVDNRGNFTDVKTTAEEFRGVVMTMYRSRPK